MRMSQRRPISPARSASRYPAGKYWVFTLSGAAAVTGVLVVLGFPLVSSFLAMSLLAICVYPTYDYILRDVHSVPAIPVLMGAFALQLALPVFTGEHVMPVVHSFAEITEESIVSALLLANLAALIVVWICTSKITRQAVTALPVLRLHLNRTRAVAFCIVFGALAVITTAGSMGSDAVELGAISRVIRNQTLVIIALLAWLSYDTGNLWFRLIWYAAIVIGVVVGMSTLFVEAAVAPLAIMFLCTWLYARKVDKRLIVAAIVAVLFLNPGKGEVRQKVWDGQLEASAPERAALWADAALQYWWDALQGHTSGSEGAKAAAMRSNHIYLLARVVERTPEFTPYLYGETYLFFLYSPIPRFLWPDKPTATANTLLALRYQLTNEESAEKNTFGIGLLGEGYANFGVAGVIFIAGVLGTVLLVMMRLFGGADAGAGGAAIMMSFFIYFLNGLGSSAEILFGNVFQSMLASYLMLYWVSQNPVPQPRSR